MAFTYDMNNADPIIADLSKVRLWTGDSVEFEGPHPDGRNFTDAELNYFYDTEGSHVLRTVAAVMETLANTWSTFSGKHQLGPESQEFLQAKSYSERAGAIREQYGWNTEGTSAQSTGGFVIHPKPAS